MYFFHLQEFEEDLKAGKTNAIEDDNITIVRKQIKNKYKRKKRFGMKTRNQKPKGLSKAARRKLDDHQKKLAQQRVRAVEHMVRQVTAASGVPKNSLVSPRYDVQADKVHGFEVSLISPKKKSSIVAKTSVNSFMVEWASGSKKKRKNSDNGKKASKRKCLGVSDLELKPKKGLKTCPEEQNSNASFAALDEKKSKEKDNCAVKKESEDMINTQMKIMEVSQQRDKPKTEQQTEKPLSKSKLKMIADITVHEQSVHPNCIKAAQRTKRKNTDRTITDVAKQSSQTPRPSKTKCPRDEPLFNKEYDIYVKSRRQITRSKKKNSPIKVSCA